MEPKPPMSHDPAFLSIRVDRAFKGRLNDAAAVNGMKPSDLVRYALTQWLDTYCPEDDDHGQAD